jgi:hypothetical protein
LKIGREARSSHLGFRTPDVVRRAGRVNRDQYSKSRAEVKSTAGRRCGRRRAAPDMHSAAPVSAAPGACPVDQSYK